MFRSGLIDFVGALLTSFVLRPGGVCFWRDVCIPLGSHLRLFVFHLPVHIISSLGSQLAVGSLEANSSVFLCSSRAFSLAEVKKGMSMTGAG